MWKLLLVLALVCVSAGFVRGGRVPRNDDDDDADDVSEAAGEGACVLDGDCDEGFVCHGSKCACPEAKVLANGKCVGPKGLGESCNATAECNSTMSLICESGTCQCPSDTVQVDDACVKKSPKVGDPCENGTCQSSVNGTDLCGDENAEEVDGTGCQCREGFVESEDGRSCLREASKMGDECVATRQCERVNGTCAKGACVEVTLSSVVAPDVPSPILISSECSLDDECESIKNSVCKESVCQCRESHVASEDQSKCLPLARKAGDPCEMDKQCSKVPNSSCLEGKCIGVSAAGVKARKNDSNSVVMNGSKAFLATLLLIGSRAVIG